MSSVVTNLKIGFLGAGNMAQAIIRGMLSSGTFQKQNIFASNRTERKLTKLVSDYGIQALTSNEDLIETCEVVILSMKPQDLPEAIEPMAASFNENHIVISLAAGLPLSRLKSMLPNVKNIVRVMPNTPIALNKGVVGYSILGDKESIGVIVEDIFSSSSLVFSVSEGDEFEALTVAASSGVGFLYELMIYWQEWLEEHNFNKEDARDLTVQTFLGTALMAEANRNLKLDELQKKVVSKQGVTAAGLESIRELEVERALRYSFQKSVLRDRELGGGK